MKRWLLSLGAVLVLFSFLEQPAKAAGVTELAAAFRPASGVVVMPAGDEFLIDLDAAAGLREGDLLTVVVPGEKIVHPVTGETLGSLDQVKAVLQATRVKSGYSYARPTGEAKEVARGDAVRRWENVPASFHAKQGEGDAVGRELKGLLPHLDWKADDARAELIFLLAGERLEVRGPNDRILATANVAETPAAAPTPEAMVQAPVVASPVPPPTPPAGIMAATPPVSPGAGIVRSQAPSTEGVWYSSGFPDETVGVHVADFDGDGRKEVAVAFRYGVEIGRIVDEKYTQASSLDLGYGQKILGIDGADLNGDGRVELYLTAAGGGELRSLAVVEQEGKLAILQEQIPWYLRAIELPGEGRVLLGQAMGALEEDFSGAIFRVVQRDGRLAEGDPIVIPQGVRLFGFAPLQEKGHIAYIDSFDQLKVLGADGEAIWAAEEKVGGSESYFERQDPSKNPASGPATRNAFMQGRMLPGPEGTILVPVNEGGRQFSRARSFDKSLIRAMAWNGFALQEVWHTQPQSGYLADFRLADIDNDGQDEIVQAIVFARDGLMSKPRSGIVVYELP